MKKILSLAFVFSFFLATHAVAVEVQEIVGPKSGVKAWLVEDHTLPIVALRLSFLGGSEQDPIDKQGLATLTMEALTQGAGPYDAKTFQQKLADRSISLWFGAGRDSLDGGLKCLSDDKDEAFALLRLALQKPRFASADIERLKGQQLSGIQRQFSDPGWQARYALLSRIFAGHPYSQRSLGTLETVAGLTRDDSRLFAGGHLARNNVTVAAAGAITPKELSTALDKIFLDLPAEARLTVIEDVPEVADTSAILVRREGPQAEILFSLPGPKRDDPLYHATQIANYILGGGGFASRLMQELRDKKGLSYGISTSVSPSQHAGMIVGRAAVDNSKFGESMDIIRETLRHFYQKGPTKAEIGSAKDYLTGAMPLSLTSTDKIAGLLIHMQRERLGIDYLDRYGKLIRSVDEKDLSLVIERFFNPDRMTLVVVGAPADANFPVVKDVVRQ